MNISKPHNVKSLRKRLDISRVLEKGKKVKTKYGPVFLFNEEQHNDKRAAILLKKNVGSAVKRNYIKRIIRSIIRDRVDIFFNNYNRVVFIYNYRGSDKFSLIEDVYTKRLKNI